MPWFVQVELPPPTGGAKNDLDQTKVAARMRKARKQWNGKRKNRSKERFYPSWLGLKTLPPWKKKKKHEKRPVRVLFSDRFYQNAAEQTARPVYGLCGQAKPGRPPAAGMAEGESGGNQWFRSPSPLLPGNPPAVSSSAAPLLPIPKRGARPGEQEHLNPPAVSWLSFIFRQ